MSHDPQSYNWCWTLFRLSDDLTIHDDLTRRLPTLTDFESEAIETLMGGDNPLVQFIVYQTEKAPATGRIHLQGYVQFTQRLRRSQVKAFFNSERIHLEPARGSPADNLKYCTKDDSRIDGPFYYGTMQTTSQGTRSDLLALREAIDAGATELDIAKDFFQQYCRYQRSIQRYMQLLNSAPRKSSDPPPEVTVYYGKTGVGKSRKALEEAGDKAYIHPRGNWCDLYEGQENVVFDEFDGSWMPISDLLRRLDRHPLLVPVKGSFTHWKPKKIWITSNLPVELWYDWKGKTEQLEALKRRFTKYVLLRNPIDELIDLVKE